MSPAVTFSSLVAQSGVRCHSGASLSSLYIDFAPEQLLRSSERDRCVALPEQAEAIRLGLEELLTLARWTSFAIGLPATDEPPPTNLAETGDLAHLRAVPALLDHWESALLAYAKVNTYSHHRHRFCET